VTSNERDDTSGRQTLVVPANLFPRILGIVGAGLLLCMAWAVGQMNSQVGDELSSCWAMSDDHARLVCYDKVSAPRQPAKGALVPLGPNPHEKSQ
jgi:hypothetical protein